MSDKIYIIVFSTFFSALTFSLQKLFAFSYCQKKFEKKSSAVIFTFVNLLEKRHFRGSLRASSSVNAPQFDFLTSKSRRGASLKKNIALNNYISSLILGMDIKFPLKSFFIPKLIHKA